jgi:CO/xanthine dehydrogenase FAD-binding subunit
MISVSVARYERRELHIAMGGYGNWPIRLPEAEQAFRDGAKAESLAGYARAAFQGSDDAWASGDYRSDVAATLLHRALQEVS